MNAKTRRWRHLLGAVVIGCLLVGPSQIAWAAGELHMQTQVGWDGVFKATGWTTLQITLQNQGSDFQGRILVEPTDANQGNVVFGSFEKAVNISAGKAQRVTFEVPGSMFNYPVDIEVVDGEGKQVLMQPKNQFRSVGHSLLIGGLTRNEKELNLFSLLSGSNDFEQVHVKSLEAKDIPTTPDLLEGLDLLELNSAVQDKLSQAQVQAIHKWVESGGHLLLSGEAVPVASDLLTDLSPVQVTGTGVVSDLTALQAYTEETTNVSSLQVRTGTLQAGSKALVLAGTVPLLASRTVGRGTVMYAAYDLGGEPLASWMGNKALWSKMLTAAGLQMRTTQGQNNSNDPNEDIDQSKRILVGSSGLFLKLGPSFGINLAIFGGYLLLIGPVLFWMLRRAKKQMWAWVLVPVTAVVVAGTIYYFGTESRGGGVFGQFHAQIRLLNEQSAKVEGAATFIVSDGGTYSLQVAPGMRAFVTKANFSDNDWGNGDSVRLDGSQSQLEFRHVDYWSSRGAYLSGELQHTGMVQSNLHIDLKGHLTGTLTNRTRFDLDHVFVGVGVEVIPIGDLQQGQTVTVNAPLHDNVARSMTGNAEITSMSVKMFPLDMKKRNPYAGPQSQRSLVDSATVPQNFGNAPIQLFAFTETPLNLYTFEGSAGMKSFNMSLVRQDLAWHLDPQGAKIPLGLIQPKVVKETSDVKISSMDYDHSFQMLNGELTFEYDLRIVPGFAPEQVKTDLDQAVFSLLDKQLYNWQKQTWETASSANTPLLSGNALQPYLSPDGKMQIRLHAAGLTDVTPIPFPHVGVAGKGGAQ